MHGGDLLRPSNPTFIANGQDVLSNENSRFTVRFPDGETLVATPGAAGNAAVQASGNAIADKIGTVCGAAHPKQLSAVYFLLSQSGTGSNTRDAFVAQGVKSNEHMALSFSLEKNADTGAVTITYSEPRGFPVHFRWTSTVALDGTVTSTPMVIGEPANA